MRIVVIILLLGFLHAGVSGQRNDTLVDDTLMADTLLKPLHILKAATFDGQTYPHVELKEIIVTGKMPKGIRFDYRRHARLVYNVRRVYPYALIIRDEFGRINRLLETLPTERAKRDFLQSYEKDLLAQYEGDVRRLTFTQGKILIKLIDRETSNTSYELIRQYRGKISAIFWQGIARIFGANLKSTYDPRGDDYLIEHIVREIEAGRL